jgi:hypothetical protein
MLPLYGKWSKLYAIIFKDSLGIICDTHAIRAKDSENECVGTLALCVTCLPPGEPMATASKSRDY